MENKLKSKINRSIQPSFRQVKNIPSISFEKLKLGKDMPLYLINQKEHDVVKFELVFSAGTVHQEKPLQANFVNTLFDSGTDKLSAFDIAEQFDYYGSYLESSYGKDYASVTLYTLKKHFEPSLNLLQQILIGASFPKQELDIHTSNSRQRYVINSEKVDVLAKREFSKLLFNSNSHYAYSASVSDFDNIKHSDITDFYQQNYLNTKPTLFLSGNVGEEELKTLESLLSAPFSNDNNKDVNTDASPVFNKNIQKVGSVQSAIRMGRVMFDMHHEDFAGMQVLNTLFGGYFGSRLMANIREDKGYTYGIGSAVVAYKNTGVFFIVTEVGKEVTKATLKEIKHEAHILQNQRVKAGELDLVRNYMLGKLLKRTDGAFSQMEMVKKTVLHGLPTSYHKTFEQTIREITAEQIRELAQKYLLEKDLSTVVAGDVT